MKPTSLVTLDNAHVRNLGFLSAIVGGLTLAPVMAATFPVWAAAGTGAAIVTGVAAGLGALGGLLGNLWTSEMAERRAEKLAGPKYAHPNNDLIHLLADAIVRVLDDCATASPEFKSWFDGLAAAADAGYVGLAQHPALKSISSAQVATLFERAARTDERHALNLLDETSLHADGTVRTVAWRLLEFLRVESDQKTFVAAHDKAESAIITGLFAAVREMLKRNPKGRAYAAIQLDTNGEILARLATLVDNDATLLKQHAVTTADLAEIRRLLIAQANQRFYTAALNDDQRMAVKVILDETLDAGERLHRVEGKVDKVIATQARHTDQLDRIEQLLLDQKKADPTAEPVLSDEDRATLDYAKRHGTLKARANASVLDPDAETPGLIAELRRRHEAEEFDLCMLEGKSHYFQKLSQPDAAIPFFERAMTLRPDATDARMYAAIVHNTARLGDIAAHQRKAIEIYEGTLTRVQFGLTEWAATQNNLGNAYAQLPTGDRSANLATAIIAYESALTVYTRNAHPAEWATTQNNLGISFAQMPTGDRSANLATAITAYESALTVYTRDAHPAEWAMTQNNLGISYAQMPTGDRSANLAKAITAYESRLTVYTRDAHPAAWATTQNNLGNAYAQLPTGDRAANLAKAISAYELALTVRTGDARPAEWAMTHNNLGNAYSELPSGDRVTNLAKAVAAYESALTVRTRDAHPADWATTQNNLGVALAALAELPGEDRCGRLRQSIVASKGALTVRTKVAFPREHAETAHNLAIDRVTYETGGCSADVPFDEIVPAE